MALKLVDRMLTVAVTATLTSAAWIVALSGAERERSATPAPPEPQPGPTIRPAPESSAAMRSAQGWTIPVAGVAPDQLTNTFEDERGGGTRRHEALDIPAPAGTPVLAAASGTVEKLFLSDEGGKTVYVRSDDRRTLHYYAHLRDYAPGLREGQRVNRGQQLGTVGSSGNADPAAPHLHFAIMETRPDAEWYEPAAAINPYPLLKASAEGG